MPNHNNFLAAEQGRILSSSSRATKAPSVSTKDFRTASAVSFVLVKGESQVHPQKFDIKISPRKTQSLKIGRSKELSDIVLRAKSSRDLLVVRQYLAHNDHFKCVYECSAVDLLFLCRFHVSTQQFTKMALMNGCLWTRAVGTGVL